MVKRDLNSSQSDPIAFVLSTLPGNPMGLSQLLSSHFILIGSFAEAKFIKS